MNRATTILIADDHHYMRETIRYLIAQNNDLRIIGEACNGMEAINMAAELLPDVILLDINMSPINGFEAARKIIKRNPQAKIIGLSFHRQPSYARNMLQLGALGYITKTSPYQEIMMAIRQVAKGEEYICAEIKGLL